VGRRGVLRSDIAGLGGIFVRAVVCWFVGICLYEEALGRAVVDCSAAGWPERGGELDAAETDGAWRWSRLDAVHIHVASCRLNYMLGLDVLTYLFHTTVTGPQ
jgi:hypothetical protein